VKDVHATPKTANGVYNLQGMKMQEENTDLLPHGIYVVNGKKVQL
jgi:hypothetical protein